MALITEVSAEAVTRANMRFVETKTPEQQSCLMLHRTRHLFIRQQTSVINAIRAHMAEFGIVAPVGRKGVEQLLAVVTDASDQRVPEVARAVAALGAQLRTLKAQILEFDRRILAWHRSNETSRRPGCHSWHWSGGATALVASVADPKAFRSGRNFSAWIGLVPKQHSSGGRDKLGSISKQGDRYLRSLFTAGAQVTHWPPGGDPCARPRLFRRIAQAVASKCSLRIEGHATTDRRGWCRRALALLRPQSCRRSQRRAPRGLSP